MESAPCRSCEVVAGQVQPGGLARSLKHPELTLLHLPNPCPLTLSESGLKPRLPMLNRVLRGAVVIKGVRHQ